MKEKDSRGPSLDLEQCVENVGNRYMLVVLAAERARQIKRQNRHSPYREHRFPQMTALKEFEDK